MENGEDCCGFTLLTHKVAQTIIAVLTEDKVTEIFFTTDDFCKFFDEMAKKYTKKTDIKED